ncbi:hypothetical protein L7F22_011740 [Adiantum nelumboides]|nr:hypothetical protein [Adiantum nelumboides]
MHRNDDATRLSPKFSKNRSQNGGRPRKHKLPHTGGRLTPLPDPFDAAGDEDSNDKHASEGEGVEGADDEALETEGPALNDSHKGDNEFINVVPPEWNSGDGLNQEPHGTFRPLPPFNGIKGPNVGHLPCEFCEFHLFFMLFSLDLIDHIGFDEYMNLLLDDAEEVSMKKKTHKPLGQILLKGDNITLMMNMTKKQDKELQTQRDTLIEELFGDGLEIGVDDDAIEEVQDVQEGSSQATSKAKKLRKWRPAWKYEHPWAYPVIFEGKLPSLRDHSVSDEHKLAAFKWANKEKRVCIPLPNYVVVFDDKEKVRVVTIMWQAYFVVKCAGPTELFEKLCSHQIELGLANIPSHVDYGTYLNRNAYMEFIQAIRDVLRSALCKKIKESPWYSLIVDDSTDRGKEGHFIVYPSYLKAGGRGENHVAFLKLIKTDDGGAGSKYDALMRLLNDMGLCLLKMVSLATDGCSVMVGSRFGLFARMRVDVPHLLLVHCLAHRENLAASQAIGSFPELMHLDKLCRSIYTWLHASGKRMDDLKLVEGALDLPKLAMLRIHAVRWLSQGQVMERLVKVMPALLVDFSHEKPSFYDELTLYANQFYIHLLADVCIELNVLNRQFQSDHVDIASISGYAYATLQNLKKKFLRDSAGCGTKYLQEFVKKTNRGVLTFTDAGGEMHTHTLKFDSIEGSSSGGSFEDCMHLGKELVIKVVENLNSRMDEDISTFDACKIFSPKHYPTEELECEASTKKWIEKILHQYGRLVDSVEKCMGELDSFTSILSSNFKHKGFCDAWAICKDDIIMRDSFPNLMKLWEIMSVVPVNTAAVERGFSLQNIIKTAHRTSMSVTTLENYMFIGLNGPEATSDVPWDEVFALWKTKKNRLINMSA